MREALRIDRSERAMIGDTYSFAVISKFYETTTYAGGSAANSDNNSSSHFNSSSHLTHSVLSLVLFSP